LRAWLPKRNEQGRERDSLLKNEEGKEGQGSCGELLHFLFLAFMKNEVDNKMNGYCSRMKKERRVRATVLVTTNYIQLMASR
jgi:hypothetical protein